MKNIDIKKLILSIVITFFIGGFPSIFVMKNMNSVYSSFKKPPLSPPSIIFPIVWSILFLLMGISYYIVKSKKENNSDEERLIYYLQLIINAIWTPVFFGLKQYFLAFIVLLVLIIFVIFMIVKFYKVNKLAAYLQIPYLLWILFAAYLNFGVFILNA